MSRVSVLMNFEHSAYHSVFRLAEGLIEIGHQVELLAPKPFEQVVVARGLTHRLLPAPPFAPGLGLLEKVETLADGVAALVDAERPDVVLLDQLLWTLAAPLFERGIRVLPVATNLAGSFDPRVPPAFYSFVPSRRLAWLPNTALWLAHLVKKDRASNSATLWELLRARAGRSSSAYAELQVAWKPRVERHGGRLSWGEYGLRLAGPELVLCPSELDFPGAGAGGRRIYAGACVATHPQDQSAGHDGEIPGRDGSAGEPMVYCSVGSHEEHAAERERLYRAVVEAAKRRSDLRLIVQVKDRELSERLRPLPPNVSSVEWADQLELLGSASLFVTHAGLASVKESLWCGVPMLAFPFFNDGFGNAARIRYHRLGLEGRMDRVTPEGIGTMIDRVLADPSYPAATKKLRRAFREQERCTAGVEWVDRLVREVRD